MPEQPPKLPPRRLASISLRVLLLLIALLAVWLAWVTNRARRQAEVVRVLQTRREPFGFDYEYPPGKLVPVAIKVPNAEPPAPAWLRRWVGDEYFRKVVAVSWYGRHLQGRPRAIDGRSIEAREDDAFLHKLASLGGLRSLRLYSLDVTGHALAECARALGELERLDIVSCSNVDDEVFSLIARLSKLRALTLDSKTLGLERLRHLRSLRNLEALDLTSPLLTDAALAGLDLPRLEFLQLKSDRVTGAGLGSIGRMTRLTWLRVECSASDESLEALRPLGELRMLSIRLTGGSLTDRALEAIKSFPKLDYLTLGNPDRASTHFSDEALIDLVRHLPALEGLELEEQYLRREALKVLDTERPRLILRPVERPGGLM